jgi:hypothetical protein
MLRNRAGKISGPARIISTCTCRHVDAGETYEQLILQCARGVRYLLYASTVVHIVFDTIDRSTIEPICTFNHHLLTPSFLSTLMLQPPSMTAASHLRERSPSLQHPSSLQLTCCRIIRRRNPQSRKQTISVIAEGNALMYSPNNQLRIYGCSTRGQGQGPRPPGAGDTLPPYRCRPPMSQPPTGP